MMKKLVYYIPGVALILAALMIAIAPKIIMALIAAFIATLLMIAGVGALYIGHQIRKSIKRSSTSGAWFHFSDPRDRFFFRTRKFEE